MHFLLRLLSALWPGAQSARDNPTVSLELRRRAAERRTPYRHIKPAAYYASSVNKYIIDSRWRKDSSLSVVFASPCGLPAAVMVRALDLRLRRSRVRLPVSRFQLTTLGKLFTHTHVHMSLSSIIWYQSRGGDAQRLGR